MQTEYEAKFTNIDKGQIRTELVSAGAELAREEFLQRRWVFDLPQYDKNSFARVRDEGGIFTLTVKKYSGADVDHPLESEITVDNFDNAVDILTEIGCIPRSYQENMRELWLLGDAKITIDTWPFMEPFIEIEAFTVEDVRAASDALRMDWSQALFCGVTKLFKKKYGEHANLIDIPRLTFDMPSPF